MKEYLFKRFGLALFIVWLATNTSIGQTTMAHGSIVVIVSTKRQLIISADKRITNIINCSYADTATKIYKINKFEGFAITGFTTMKQGGHNFELKNIVYNYLGSHKLVFELESMNDLMTNLKKEYDEILRLFGYSDIAVSRLYCALCFFRYNQELKAFEMFNLKINEVKRSDGLFLKVNSSKKKYRNSFPDAIGDLSEYTAALTKLDSLPRFKKMLAYSRYHPDSLVFRDKDWAITASKELIRQTSINQNSLGPCKTSISPSSNVAIIDINKGFYWKN